ncbi:hypothetical protein [Pseudoalteromonas piscicida]|uniref:Uncharacterized protein n=1 Tax=Pseudoalteromonas piscicida TaxID=43662 RepID=A0AAD0RK55_PSEO7|nr:hypothetical protein [Pseudoalteromonas piscicida]ASD69269.1 hypothetical protein B1L02_20455 [Pseudoalteromonas piscicida]AXR04367.1 hypothetical protein D0511_20845 [Pseudoalteromonas piscicida]
MSYKSVKNLVGWFVVGLSALALAPGVVPGSMSVLAFYLSLALLLISLFTISSTNHRHFQLTAIIVGVGMLVLNDYLRVVMPSPEPTWPNRIALYLLYLTICGIGMIKIKRQLNR